jgi:glutamyl-tRNA reductase
VNHRTADMNRRDALAFDEAATLDTLRTLMAEGRLSEALLLSTCNRTEVYAVAADPAAAEAAVRQEVRRSRGDDSLGPGDHRYELRGREAARHLLRVAAGLDSMVLGEKQVLGQVKAAVALARKAGATGPLLARLAETALHAGKRVRTETAIDVGAMSVASAAVKVATRVVGDLAGRRVLVVGAGETGRLAARHFKKEGTASLIVANRTLAAAQAVAAEVGGEAVPLEEVAGTLARVDVVVSATSAPGFVIAAEAVAAAMRARGSRPLVVVDLAVPRDVEPVAGELKHVFLYTVDALRTMVDEGLDSRRREVPKAEAIVEEECGRVWAWCCGRGTTPVVRELREHFERVRAEEVGKSLRHFSSDDQAQVEQLTRALVNKLLHLPTLRLKEIDLASEEGRARLSAARRLFALGDEGQEERDA